MTDEEQRKLKQREYARAHYLKTHPGAKANKLKKDGDGGLSKKQFEKYLHKGPISEGGTGE